MVSSLTERVLTMKNESEKPNLNPLDFTPRPMENLFEELSHFESKSNVSPKVFSEIKRPGQSLTCNPRDSLDLFPEAILFNLLELSVGTNSKRNYLERLYANA